MEHLNSGGFEDQGSRLETVKEDHVQRDGREWNRLCQTIRWIGNVKDIDDDRTILNLLNKEYRPYIFLTFNNNKISKIFVTELWTRLKGLKSYGNIQDWLLT